jgi:hypothetical protein
MQKRVNNMIARLVTHALIFAAACIPILADPSARATLIVDPGFEQIGAAIGRGNPIGGGTLGVTVGWYNPQTTVANGGVPNDVISTSPVNSGTYSMYMAESSHNAGYGVYPYDAILYQNINVTIDEPYTVSFYADTETGTTGSLTVTLNGTPVKTGLQPNDALYSEFTYTVTPTSASGVLSFDWSAPDYGQPLWLDDVSVTPIPEPAAAGFLGVAAFGLLARHRHRKFGAAFRR